MKLRLCILDFQKVTRIQIGESIKTKKPKDSITIIELGAVESFGKPHLCGVISEDIVNVGKVRNNIKEIEKMNPDGRIEWFSSNFPRARIVKIESNKIFDRLKDTKKEDQPVVISSAAELKWDK